MNTENMYVYTSLSKHVVRRIIDSKMAKLCNGDDCFDQNNSNRNSWGGGPLYA
ncbi:hypothetical protein [Candidatus Nitrosocosmicus hydrocola]|uniref:hypothetical protein n=1 Tax=Candidatus Nitrosocosmicus hydrocola TaxID=1826872 RepID=UPI001372D989|nr:hypothetical protein [Candidatus Nitrosocosmicus hydrocola]